MVILAKYDGRCAVCGKRISAGAEIEWSREDGARHVACARQDATQAQQVADHDGPTWRLHGGSGYGCNGWTVGQIVRAADKRRADDPTCPEWLYVLSAQRRYVREDGLSCGVGNDSGHLYSATCRAATPAEAAPAIAARTQKESEKVAAAARADTIREICDLCRAGESRGDVDLPAGTQIVVREGSGNSGREIVVLGTDGSVSYWCSGYYDDYIRSLHVTRDARAASLATTLAGGTK